MAHTTTKCEFPRCRNVGRREYDLTDEETGEVVVEYIGKNLICKKHLLETLEMALAWDDEEWQLRTESGTVLTEPVDSEVRS